MNLNRLTTFTTAAAFVAVLAAPHMAAAQTTTPASPAATSAAPATTTASPSVVAKGDIVETLKASGQFTMLLKATDATNLTAVLKNNQGLTLFAPTDAAFAAVPQAQMTAMMADKAGLQKAVMHHLINAKVDSSKIKGAKGPVPSVAGDKIELDGSTDVLKADNATIIQADVTPTNGVIHVVDAILTPGAATAVAPATEEPAAATAATAPAQ
ncbi:fasciclin domain-containing protein [Phenylobacterium immobile]|uniref:fasciclin domain-containing protein n=1 Tax=Phenylobacterium immobile TaxID=21 RepID=UPI000A3FA718|nr:fasciclin domain-containing protein [Phenylobacterium immobile]